MSTASTAAQALGISASLIGAGGILALSLFDVPELQAQPADRSLPAIRWLFSRGSHIFPQAAFISSAAFAYAAYDSLPKDGRTVSQLLKSTPGPKFGGFVLAAVLAFGIAPFTSYMIPNNFALIEKNEKLGGSRSAASANAARQQGFQPGHRTAEESVNSKNDINELKDLSNPQTKAPRPSTGAEDREVKEMLGKFGRQNLVRALLMGGGGIVGLLTALA